MSGEGQYKLNNIDYRDGSNNILVKMTATANTLTYVGESSSTVLVKGLTDPVAAQDSATKAYVDANTSKTWKESVKAATVNNIVLSPAPSTIDGIEIVEDDRVLVKNQLPTWTTHTIPASATVQDVVWSPELRYFVGVNTTVVSVSQDGLTWTTVASNSTNSYRRVTYSPDLQLFVSLSDTSSTEYIISSDALTWTTQDTGLAALQFNCIAWSPQLEIFVAGTTTSTIAISSTGLDSSWTTYTGIILREVIWSPGVCLFIGNLPTGQIYSSPDGITWTFRQTMNTDAVTTWSPDLDLFVSTSIGSNPAYSSNGTSWTSFSSIMRANDIVWSPELGIFVATLVSVDRYYYSTTGTSWISVSGGGGNRITWSSELGIFVVSTDGSSSIESGTPSTNGIYVLDSGGDLIRAQDALATTESSGVGVFVCEGSVNGETLFFCISSPKGSTFETNAIFVAYPKVPAGSDKEVQYNNEGTLSASSNFLWNYNTNTLDITGIVQSNTGLFDNVGGTFTWRGSVKAATTANISLSPAPSTIDGVTIEDEDRVLVKNQNLTWVTQTSPNSGLTKAEWSPELGLFVVAYNPNVITSPDGINWTSRTTGAGNTFSSIVWSPELGLFLYTTRSAALAISSDGITWTTYTGFGGYSSAWAPEVSLFYAGGSSKLSSSSDGMTWTTIANVLATPLDMAWSSELQLLVLVGTSSISYWDGTSLTASTGFSTGAYRSVAWSPKLSLFVAISATMLARSSDGISWTTVANSSASGFIAWSPELELFMINSTSNYQYSYDGISWTTVSGAGASGGNGLVWSPEMMFFIGSGGPSALVYMSNQVGNGIYRKDTDSGDLVRTNDALSGTISSGNGVYVTNGDVNGDTLYMCTNASGSLYGTNSSFLRYNRITQIDNQILFANDGNLDGSYDFTWNDSTSVLSIVGTVATTGSIRSNTSIILEDPGAGSNTITIQAPTLNPNASYTLTLPVDDGTASQVLTTDGSGILSWTTPAGSGDVVGPGSATNNAIALFDGATGKLIKDSVSLTYLDSTDTLSIGTGGTTSAITGAGSGNLTISSSSASVLIESVTFTGAAVSGVSTLTASSTITATGSIRSNASIILEDPGAGSNTITIQAPTLNPNASYTLTLPVDDGTASQVLTTDGSGILSWTTPSGTGDVVGPGSATNNAIALFDGATGKLIKDSVSLTYLDSTDTLTIGTGGTTSAITGAGSGNLTISSSSASVLIESVTFTGSAVSTITSIDSDSGLDLISSTSPITLDSDDRNVTTSTTGTIVDVKAMTATQTGATTDIVFSSFAQPTVAGAFTATQASTVYIANAPTVSGATITNPWALNVAAGNVNLGAQLYVPNMGSNSGNALGITGGGQIVDTISLRAYKKDEIMFDDPNAILKLRPKYFTWKESNEKDLGFVVEDALETGSEDFLYIDSVKGPKNMKDRAMIAGLVACVKNQNERIEYLETKMKELMNNFK